MCRQDVTSETMEAKLRVLRPVLEVWVLVAAKIRSDQTRNETKQVRERRKGEKRVNVLSVHRVAYPRYWMP